MHVGVAAAQAAASDAALRAPLVGDEHPRACIDLGGYTVRVDMYDTHYGITLEPMPTDSSRRTWHLRAASEEVRLLWTQKLVRATKWATQQRAVGVER